MTEQNEQSQQEDHSEYVSALVFERRITSSDGQVYDFVGGSKDGICAAVIIRDGQVVYHKREGLTGSDLAYYEWYAEEIVGFTKNVRDEVVPDRVEEALRLGRYTSECVRATKGQARVRAAAAYALYDDDHVRKKEMLAVAQFWATMAITAPERSS